MKIKKVLHRYFQEQVDAVRITAGGIPMIKPDRRGAESRMFNVAFHAVLIGLILVVMIAGRYQPSHLGEMMFQVTERYGVDDRMVHSFRSLIQLIKDSKHAGGAL